MANQQQLTLIHADTEANNLNNMVIEASTGAIAAGLRKMKLQLVEKLSGMEKEQLEVSSELDAAVTEAGNEVFDTNEIIQGFINLFKLKGEKGKIEHTSTSLVRSKNEDKLQIGYKLSDNGSDYHAKLKDSIEVPVNEELASVIEKAQRINSEVRSVQNKIHAVETEYRKVPEMAATAKSAMAMKSLRKDEQTSKLLDEIMKSTVESNPLLSEALGCLKD